MGLGEYKKKRNFEQTPEPIGGKASDNKELTFVIQRHQATRLHYDLRLELDGVLKSWAIPKGPSMVAGEKHLAVMVEDHPLDYAEFYGEIPEGNYGAGIVDIFDSGIYTPYNAPEGADPQQHLLQQIEKGDLKVVFKGKHIKGAFAIVRLKGDDNSKTSNWLIIKKKDKYNLPEFDIEALKPVKKTRKTKKKKSEKDDFHKNIPKDNIWTSVTSTQKRKTEDKPQSNKRGQRNIPASKDTEIIEAEDVKKEDALLGQKGRGTKSSVSDSANDKEFEKDQSLTIGRKKVKLTNLTKVYWPDEGITKGDLIKYYLEVSDFILPYLKDRPQSLNRFPNGIKGPSFYHKDMDVDQLPPWAKTVKIYSKANDREIDYLICNDLATLLYMANLGCIEINPWHSVYHKEDYPDYFILDLDPGDISFKEVVNTALVIKEISDELQIDSYCKTSGATGLHIYFPLGAKYDYDQVKIFAEILANLTHSRIPSVTTVVRTVSKRGNAIYVDFLQNRKGQTIAAPYSVRPRPMATVSTPLDWKEVNESLSPELIHYTQYYSPSRESWRPVERST